MASSNHMLPPKEAVSSGASDITWYQGVILTLLGLQAWMVHRWVKLRKKVTSTNGNKLGGEDYIKELESYIETQRSVMQTLAPRTATLESALRGFEEKYARQRGDIAQTLEMHDDKFERLQGQIDDIVGDIRDLRNTSARVAAYQENFGETLQVILQKLESFEQKFPLKPTSGAPGFAD